jgi:predicted amidohydrolase YtcJ
MAHILPSGGGKAGLPGLIDNHLHIIRGGPNFNIELRRDGVRSLADAMNMLKRQVAVTPPLPRKPQQQSSQGKRLQDGGANPGI